MGDPDDTHRAPIDDIIAGRRLAPPCLPSQLAYTPAPLSRAALSLHTGGLSALLLVFSRLFNFTAAAAGEPKYFLCDSQSTISQLMRLEIGK